MRLRNVKEKVVNYKRERLTQTNTASSSVETWRQTERHRALFRLDEPRPSSVKEKGLLPFSFQYLRNTVS